MMVGTLAVFEHLILAGHFFECAHSPNGFFCHLGKVGSPENSTIPVRTDTVDSLKLIEKAVGQEVFDVIPVDIIKNIKSEAVEL